MSWLSQLWNLHEHGKVRRSHETPAVARAQMGTAIAATSSQRDRGINKVGLEHRRPTRA
jgi:hypothetical protein